MLCRQQSLAAEHVDAELVQEEPIAQDMSESRKADLPVNSRATQKETSFCILQIIDFPCSLLVSATKSVQRISSKVFEDWLPKAVIKLHWLWIALLVCLTAGFLCVNFVNLVFSYRPPKISKYLRHLIHWKSTT
ncbi:hypothetical protein OS493_016016 [Desmophyllum pertusum]|uniref:Uncharacterized protein n=1 Tax=Desmophyllum pertusum TaxID=174260 RepID=A0A9W9YG58_9CNID|nr:hypothetical protein OS493_016016 [Desmophyllum pertusum]